jgi:hypothetical protein
MLTVALVILGLLLLTALAGTAAQPRKKKYCPFCGRHIEFMKLPKGAKLICPYCGEAADTNP